MCRGQRTWQGRDWSSLPPCGPDRISTNHRLVSRHVYPLSLLCPGFHLSWVVPGEGSFRTLESASARRSRRCRAGDFLRPHPVGSSVNSSVCCVSCKCVSTVLSTVHAPRHMTGLAAGLSHPALHSAHLPVLSVGMSLGEASDRLADLHAAQGLLTLILGCVLCSWNVAGAQQKADGRRMTLSVVADERASCAFSLDRS